MKGLSASSWSTRCQLLDRGAEELRGEASQSSLPVPVLDKTLRSRLTEDGCVSEKLVSTFRAKVGGWGGFLDLGGEGASRAGAGVRGQRRAKEERREKASRVERGCPCGTEGQ